MAAKSKKRRILIVTDKFPPDVAGGAEVSLHLVARKLLESKIDIAVAVLSDRRTATVRLEYDGFRIYQIPFNGSWPPAARYLARRRNKAASSFDRLLIAFGYVLRGSNWSFRQRLSNLLLYRSLRKLRRGGMFPLLDRDLFRNNVAEKALAEVIETERPSLIHADNYRSIMVASRMSRLSIAITATVRDNRFFCSHPQMPVNVGGHVCEICLHQCVDVDAPQESKRLAALYADSFQQRQAALSTARRVIVTSKYLRDQIGQIVPNSEISIIPNSPDDRARVDAIQASIKRADPPEILIVGMVNENKGQTDILNWLDPLSKDLDDFRIVIAGRGERLLNQIKARLGNKGARDRVVIPGFLGRDELYRLYARASVVAVPVVWPEPFGRVPLEAGLSRRPVVAYALGGLTETIVDGLTGRLISPGDRDGFICAIIELLRKPDLAAKLGSNARRRILRRYSTAKTAKALAKVWDEVQ